MSDYDDSTETVDFPDGTEITDPYTDNLGYVYESQDDYVDGTDQYVVTDDSDEASEAY